MDLKYKLSAGLLREEGVGPLSSKRLLKKSIFFYPFPNELEINLIVINFNPLKLLRQFPRIGAIWLDPVLIADHLQVSDGLIASIRWFNTKYQMV